MIIKKDKSEIENYLSDAANYSGYCDAVYFPENESDVVDILKLKENELRKLRREEISMIFQEPLTALNPVLKCGKQLMECLELAGIPKKDWQLKSVELLKEVSLLDTDRVLNSYPFELSGGQRQRIMIAMALASNPKLIIADEPTTALDVLVTQEIIELLKKNLSDGQTDRFILYIFLFEIYLIFCRPKSQTKIIILHT